MKASKVIFYLITIISLLAISISAQEGTLDPTFGVGGVVETSIEIDELIQQKILPDNKMLLLVSMDTTFVLIKVNEDGSIDNSFGTNGMVTLESGEDSTIYKCEKIDVLENGKILLLENRKKTRRTIVPGGDDLFYAKTTNSIIRLNSDGDYDNEFGENGVLNIYAFESDALLNSELRLLPYLYDINVRPNNTVLIRASNDGFYKLIRLNYDGSYDLSFGASGEISGSVHFKVDNDENIYNISNGGGLNGSFEVVKYSNTGTKYLGYGGSGSYRIVSDSIGYANRNIWIEGIDVDINNNLLIALRVETVSDDESLIFRVTPNGISDNTFANEGMRIIDLSEFGSDYQNASREIYSMIDGNIIWGGLETASNSYNNFFIAKFAHDGSPDNLFANNGIVFSNSFDETISAANKDFEFVVRPDNQNIVISTTKNDTLYFVRYLNSRTYSSTRVSGNVAGKWEGIDTVYVDGDITIPQDQSLTIRPGTNVYFTGEYKLDIYGQLIANGTETDSIFFFSDSLGKDENYNRLGHWWGLGFKNLDLYQSLKSELSYCDFKYALSKDYNNWEADLDADSIGAPIRLYKSSNVSLNHLTISECYAYYFGSLHLIKSSPEISNISIKNMRGTISLRDNSNPSIKDITFSEARIVIADSSPIIDNLLIENYIGVPFIGINFDGVVKNSIFRNNTYYSKNGGGAFSLSDGSSAKFDNVLFKENQQLYASGYLGSGGAGFIRDSSPEFINCEFIGNISSGNGGAISTHSNDYSQYWISTFDNCLFVKNRAMQGGGTITTSTKTAVHLTNCTIADNTASWFAGVDNTGGCENIITNTIIYGNGPNFDQQMTTQWSSHVLTYNIIQGEYYGKDTTSSNIHDVDPLFRDTSANDYHLQSIACGNTFDSPAIDAGDPAIGDKLLDCGTAGLGLRRSDIGAFGGEGNWWDKSVLPICHFAGNVSGVWECETIYIDGDILIPEGDTLRITESVDKVLITGPYQIKVEGVLLAIGAERDGETQLDGDYIKFQGSDWKGIFFNNLNQSSVETSIIENCRFDYADKMDMPYQGGGAIAIYNSDKVKIKHSLFYANTAKFGGAMYIENSNPHIEDCYFELNGKEIGQDKGALATAGGAMYVKNSNPYLHRLQFFSNYSISGGGAIVFDNSSTTISNVLFGKNNTDGLGGAVEILSDITGASLKVVNMTSAENVAMNNGGGTFHTHGENSELEVINSIMYGNSKVEIFSEGKTPVITYSIIDSAATEPYFGEGCFEDNPYFATGTRYKLSNNSCSYSDGNTVVSTAIDAGHPDSLDAELDCYAGLGTSRADLGYYGGRYSDIPVGFKDEIETQIPNKYELAQNYPNPFNPSTTIQFALPKTGLVSLKIYNILGEEVATIINKEMNAGFQSVNFDAAHLSSGLYFYRISSGNFVDVKKMLLLK